MILVSGFVIRVSLQGPRVPRSLYGRTTLTIRPCLAPRATSASESPAGATFPGAERFIPKICPKSAELEFAGRHFNSIEINGTFYSLQSPASFRAWYGQTPDDFVFSAKGGRFLTHMHRLRNVKIPLANFFASGLLLLKEKLGPILWQFPPNFSLDRDRFEEFFDLLPCDTESAAALAAKHHEKLRLGTWTKTDANRKLRYAVEIRHESFADPTFIKLLRKYNVALVVADTAGKWPMIEDITADFSYVRLHGDEELYASGYTDAGARSLGREWLHGALESNRTMRAASRHLPGNFPPRTTCLSFSTTT